MAVFELAGVSKSYSGIEALAPTDLCIVPSRTTILIGPSGSGKSTLLRLLVRLMAPDTGVVRFEDQILDDNNARALRQRMGFVVQTGGLFPHLTAWDNVALMVRYLRWPKAEIEARVYTLAALTHFPHSGLARYPAQLSGGERQRVSLMRALMLDPDVLLLDEPLGALDPMIRFDLQNELKEIFESLKKTVVMVTHDLAEARFFEGPIVLMCAGHIIQQGAFEELVQAPTNPIVERFVRAQRAWRG